VNREVCSNELSTITESTVPFIIDEGFESNTGELDPYTSDNTISENLSVVSNSVDIPDVIDLVIDIPMNNTREEVPKCHNGVEVQTKGIAVICDFCPFESNRVKKFHQHLREVAYMLKPMVIFGHTLSLAVNESCLKSFLKRRTVE